jgi:hypothetical protein
MIGFSSIEFRGDSMKRYIGLTLLFLFTVMCTDSPAVQITVGSGNAQPGQSVVLPITVDVPGGIAGAAFTLTYDTTKLTLDSITSTFFDTFTNQWSSLLPVPNPLPPGTVVVDNVTYNQPLLKNTVINVGTRIAAARCKAGAVSTTLFTVAFTVKPSVTPGEIPVNIIQTVLNNTNAGYSAGGEAVPILIGALDNQPDLSLAYPVLQTTIVPGKVTIPVVDSDGDGIDDAWEISHFGNLTTANATSDYDGDGYSDKQEYLNSKNGVNDPNGNPFDPKTKNAPGGTGFQSLLAASFAGSGLWVYNSANWVQITSTNPENMVLSGLTIYGDFGTSGIWRWDGTAWKQIASVNPDNMVASGSELFVDFGGSGLWKWDGTAWSQLTTANPENMVISGSVLYVDFGGSGLWRWNGTAWSQLTAGNPENMVSSTSALFGDFGTSGLWKWNGTAWSQFTPANPENMLTSDSTLYVDFGTVGLWRLDGTTWSQLTPVNPENMVISGSMLYVDFGGSGLWRYNGSSWSQLTGANPAIMAISN